METTHLPQLREALIILVAAAVVVPLFHRFRLSPLLGFMAAGIVVGPYGLGALTPRLPWLGVVTLSDRGAVEAVAEFGIILLLFMIGLELTFERLKAMRRLVFGLGGAHLLVSGLAIAGVVGQFGQPPAVALVIGFTLALSSTAIVIQVLASQKRMGAPVGRISFAVLLFQDLAVVPMLLVVGILGARGSGAGSGIADVLLALVPALIAVALLFGLGRLAMRPLFRLVADTRSPELFMAACLLVALGAGVATALAGFSMALGAFIAGLLLAETEYRREIEVMIEPFKGLLLGVFLISVGMRLDLGLIADQPAYFAAAALGLIGLKAALFGVLGRLFRLSRACVIEAGLLLGAGGEFAFVIIGTAVSLGVVGRGAGDFALGVATLTMATIPLIARGARWSTDRLRTEAAARRESEAASLTVLPHQTQPHVIIAGFGRVGQVVADLMRAHAIPFLAVDENLEVVAAEHRRGHPVYYGNATRADFLMRCELEGARGLIITMDNPQAVEDVVKAARSLRTDLPIIARARDARHAHHLYDLGVTDAVPETVEASLQLSETALVEIGVPMGRVIASIHDKRAQFRAALMEGAPPDNPRRRLEQVRGTRSPRQPAP